jgi:hypothetical protein
MVRAGCKKIEVSCPKRRAWDVIGEGSSGSSSGKNLISGCRPDPEGRAIMQYLLMVYADEAGFQKLSKAEQEAGVAAYTAYFGALKNAGVIEGLNRLQPSATATTLRIADGKTQVLDGPYADSKEQIGGYFLLDVPDLDAALAWAARCPGASHGAVEIRPIWEMRPGGICQAEESAVTA